MEIPEIETQGDRDELKKRVREETDSFEECEELADKAAEEGKWAARVIIMDIAGDK
jgi:hypothetical protein